MRGFETPRAPASRGHGRSVRTASWGPFLSGSGIPVTPLCLVEAHHAGDRRRQPIPVGGFPLEMPAPRARQRIELGPAVVLCRFPLGADPALVLELVER